MPGIGREYPPLMLGDDDAPEREPLPGAVDPPPLMRGPPAPPPRNPPPLMRGPPAPPPRNPPPLMRGPPPPPPREPPPPDPPPRCANAGIVAHTNRIVIAKVIFENLEFDIQGLRYSCARPTDEFAGVGTRFFALHRLDSTPGRRVASRQFKNTPVARFLFRVRMPGECGEGAINLFGEHGASQFV
jgi:hypothetical protein